ncbi:T9SS type A sorting domain-containing protein, partial [Mesonia sp. K7]|uniref:T9SS type A sorting domain-containing protein n=1 Tax=Mesonia sp. K7 TaxID=2218606 RepID=UPI000DB26AAB
TIVDANGVVVSTDFEIEPQIIDIDLGPDQILTTSQPTTVLEGNAYVQDPDATYQWYYNGELMLHTDPILEVGTPGEYTLVITNGDRTCTVTDTIVISNEFHCDVTETQYCEPIYLSDIHIDVTGGFFTYHTNIKSIDGGGIDYSQAHNDDTTLSNIPPGGYLITVRDKLGAICTKEIEIGCYGGKAGQDQAEEESIASKNENTQSNIEDQVLDTKIYPNPSNANSNFHYEVSCGNEINGVVEIFNTSGAILQRKEIRGSSTYRLQFNLLTSGLYFIRVSSDAGSKVDKIIIR